MQPNFVSALVWHPLWDHSLRTVESPPLCLRGQSLSQNRAENTVMPVTAPAHYLLGGVGGNFFLFLGFGGGTGGKAFLLGMGGSGLLIERIVGLDWGEDGAK